MPGPRLSLQEREENALGIASGRSLIGVARGLGSPFSTVAREVAHDGGRRHNRAVVAKRATRRRASRPKDNCLEIDDALARKVERWLRQRHSPLELREPAVPPAS